ncbi:MAG: hypothetical protein HXS54_14575 [Theionarchaea archaeon]|nr:hypothetical protein [Theionarchaea archaeon]
MKNSKSEYKILNCTPNQLMSLLKALRDGGALPHLVNVLVRDRDAHHQRGMAKRFGLVEKVGSEYVLTDLGKKLISLYETDEFVRIFREECINRVPLLRDMLRFIKSGKQVTRNEFLKAIKDLVRPIPDWSPRTENQYVNLVIGYLKLGGTIEYNRRQRIIRYIL